MGRGESEAGEVPDRSRERPRDSAGRAPGSRRPQESGTHSLEIRPARLDDLPAVARVHTALYETQDLRGHSLARLGPTFLERYFYRLNLDNPHFFCDIALVDGDVIGFSVYSTRRRRVFRYPLVRHPVASTIALLRSTFDGGSPTTVFHNLRYIFAPEVRLPAHVSGWWIVAGVSPDHRGSVDGGPSIAALMFDAMEERMRRDGCRAWYGAVRSENVAINRFLKRRGGAVVGTKRAQGLDMVYYVASMDQP